ncbi:methionyl-tRNA formyltransferase [Leifsonia sp. AK011]|uniref:methionyl-tRNA formyltransferase n=1 Tax=Leifsonia sp. AK011 TaxID=2723075 RepID=UPI0015C9B93F|nr:methionyl-tRNA formyltransferase [Leifsonia sp. AK011]NYF10754.1 methionyl-tRNA formyltransferase [Leifsonia sp. AK011]
MRIVFAGSPAAAVPSLEALARSTHEIVAVITREDSPQGRRGTITPTPVAARAEELGLPVIRANRLSGDVADEVIGLRVDLGVIVAYGGLVREPLLSAPRLGWINLHFSLLPRWRGAAPVQHSIIAGDDVTGATVFQLVPELDAGDILATMSTPLGKHRTSGSLLEELSESGAELLVRVVDDLASGSARAKPQVGEVTYAPKLSLADGEIDWTRPAQVVHDLIRGLTPEPGSFTTVDGARLKVLEAAIAHDSPPLAPGEFELRVKSVLVGTGSAPLELLSVHPAGRKAMDAGSWWRGRPARGEVSAS